MSTALLVVAAILTLAAAAVHVVIFVFESVRWTQPAVWHRFGVASQADADTIRPMAQNQGFYNLFLAVGAVGGVLLLTSAVGAGVGLGMVIFALGCMVAASVVLVVTQPGLVRAAATQGALPLAALVVYALALTLG